MAFTYSRVSLLLLISSVQISGRQLKRDGDDDPSEAYFPDIPDLNECQNYCSRECEEIYLDFSHELRSCEFMESFCDCGLSTATVIIVVAVCILLALGLLIFSGICCCSVFGSLKCGKQGRRSYSPLLEANYETLMNEEEATAVLPVPSAPPPYGMTGYGSVGSSYSDAPPTYAEVLKGRRMST